MAEYDTQDVATPEDEDERKPIVAAPPEPPAYGPPHINPLKDIQPPIAPAAGPAPDVQAPTVTAPPAAPLPDTGAGLSAGPASKPSWDAINRLSPIQQQNPFSMLMAKEDNIHNPFLRILAKAATGIGRGAETLSPDYPQIAGQRMQAAAQPSETAARQATTAETAARTAAIPAQTGLQTAETAKTEAETKLLQNPKPKLLPGEENTATGPDGVKYQAYEMADGTKAWAAEGQLPSQSPQTGAQATGGAQGGSPSPPAAAGPQIPAAGPQRTPTTPQAPAPGLPAGATVGKVPVATPEAAAKLAPVGAQGAAEANQQIKDMLGKKAGDFTVKPTDSRERADEILKRAQDQDNVDRGKSAEGRGAEAQARAEQNEDLKTVQGTDPKTGRSVITTLGDAKKSGLQDMLPVSSAEIATSHATLTNVNLMEQALKQLHENASDFDALTTKDRTYLNEILNSKEMIPAGGALGYVSGSINQAVNSAIQSAKYQGLTEPAKNVLLNIANLRESSLGLGKLETGGSRSMQAAIDAINKTIPGSFITNSKDAEQQMRMFADRLEEIKADSPLPKGKNFRESPFAAAKPSANAPVYASAPGKPRMMSSDGGKTWQTAK